MKVNRKGWFDEVWQKSTLWRFSLRKGYRIIYVPPLWRRWETLNQMPELINLLAEIERAGTEPTLEEFAAMLRELDYEDRTEYERSDI